LRGNQERIKTTYLDHAIDFIDFLIDLMIQLELRFNERLDAERLRRAVSLSLDAEPIVGCRLVFHWYRSYFQRMGKDFWDAFSITEESTKFDAFRSELIDTYQGPQLKVCLYRSAERGPPSHQSDSQRHGCWRAEWDRSRSLINLFKTIGRT